MDGAAFWEFVGQVFEHHSNTKSGSALSGISRHKLGMLDILEFLGRFCI